ncbi:MAG: 3-oxoacyl-ACP reductase FabG [Myxococcaceae bacterium]|nr:3-oxoacyl-ACP reductase FabG [Myxococcaceae bacterium]
MSETVLVTGASGVLGRAMAVALAQAGFDVVLHYRNQPGKAAAVADEITQLGRATRLLQFDVTDRAATRKALEADVDAHGAYYGVVVNAGLTRDNAFPALTPDDWDLVLTTNLDGFFNVVQPLVMPMIRRRKGGRIVAIASVSGLMGNRGQVNYSASKAGLIGAAKALAVELASRHITVNCVAPGLIESDMAEQARLDELLPAIPMQRLGKPEEVAAAVVYLLSPGAAYVTRQVLSVNGGLV